MDDGGDARRRHERRRGRGRLDLHRRAARPGADPAPSRAVPHRLRRRPRQRGVRALRRRRAAELRLLRVRRRAGLVRLVQPRFDAGADLPGVAADADPGLHARRQRDGRHQQPVRLRLRRGVDARDAGLRRRRLRPHPLPQPRRGLDVRIGQEQVALLLQPCPRLRGAGQLREEIRRDLGAVLRRGLLVPVGRAAPRHGGRRGGAVLQDLRTRRRALAAHAVLSLPRRARSDGDAAGGHRGQRPDRHGRRPVCGRLLGPLPRRGAGQGIVPRRTRPAGGQPLQDRGQRGGQEGAGSDAGARFLRLEHLPRRACLGRPDPDVVGAEPRPDELLHVPRAEPAGRQRRSAQRLQSLLLSPADRRALARDPVGPRCDRPEARSIPV